MERPQLIRKGPADVRLAPNLADYDGAAPRLHLGRAPAQRSTGLPGGRGSTSPTRRSTGTPPGRCAERTALRFAVGATARRCDLTYARARRAAPNRFANVLRGAGRRQGRPGLRARRAHPRAVRRRARRAEERHASSRRCSRPSGPSRSRTRIDIGERAGAGHHRGALPAQGREARATGCRRCEHVLLVGEDGGARRRARHAATSRALMAAAADDFAIAPTDARGHGAAALHQRHHRHAQGRGARARGGASTHYATGRYALDLHPDDVFWCTADPGWVTGTSYGIIAPLLHGVTSIVDEAEFDAERWYRILAGASG